MGKEKSGEHMLPQSVSAACAELFRLTGNTADLNIVRGEPGGVKCAVASVEGMASSALMSELIFQPLERLGLLGLNERELFEAVSERGLLGADKKTVPTLEETLELLFSGFAVVLVEGSARGVAVGVQGFDKKAVTEPTSEHNIMSSQEGFCEALRTNISLVRRRMKTPTLRFELIKVGRRSCADVCLCYISDRADPALLRGLRERLQDIGLDTILASGYVKPFIEGGDGVSLFSCVASTERPDVVCAGLNEGRAALLIDGSPFALLLPSVFSEGFCTMDDYCSKPYFTALMRAVRFSAFFFAVLLPGLYVAAANFHPETLTLKLLLNLTASEHSTPYSLFVEMLIITLLLELIKEASVRMPKAVGSAISIAGGLVIGDAAVKSGLISSPLLIIVGLTASAAFVVPSLSQQISILRLVFIIAGGTAGLFGIGAVLAMTAANASALQLGGIEYTSPLLPLRPRRLLDVVARRSFSRLDEEECTVAGLSGREQQDD
ncbi:MAG: spore germination protein [Ruminococcus sp.]|nr:spore germination protein [Ruminococcus sp.]